MDTAAKKKAALKQKAAKANSGKKPEDTVVLSKRLSPTKRFWMRFRYGLAQNLLKLIFGRRMHVSATPKGLVVGMVVFWYLENGQRKFLMFREARKGAQARFVGSLDAFADENLQDGVLRNIDAIFGESFLRTIDEQTIDADRVTSAPRLTLEDDVTGKSLPVQAICWQVQIRPEHAHLCVPKKSGIEVLAVPEFGLMGPEVAGPHKHVFQSVLRHIEKQSLPAENLGLSQLEEMLAQKTGRPKILH